MKRGFLRNVGVYLLFVLIYWAFALVVFLFVYFVNKYEDDANVTLTALFSAFVAGSLGMILAVHTLDRYFRPYPEKTFAHTFIGISLAMSVVGYGLDTSAGLPLTFKNLTSSLALFVACVTCWYQLVHLRKPENST